MASRPADIPAAVPADPAEGSGPVLRARYFPCFEGLRALAAVAVVVHHAASNAGPVRAGFLATPAAVMDGGVSIFFVISGFLLYRPFVAAGAEGRPPTPPHRFWWRRFLRIVPAYWVALTVLWGLGWITVGEQWWRFYLFLQVYDPFTTLNGIVPAWSLNTEVTFYLFVPLWALVLRYVLGRGRPSLRLELAGALSLVAAGYVSRVLFSASDRVWAIGFEGQEVTMRSISFAWLPNQIDLFALGMVLAVLSVWAGQRPDLRARLDRLARPAGAWWAAAAAAWLALAYFVGDASHNGGYQGGYWQLRQATLGFVAVALLVPAVFGDQDRGVIRGGLRSRPVVWLGAVSYGLYLWHLDVIEEVPGWLDRVPGQVPIVVLLAAGLVGGTAAAAVSWYAIERPLQRLRRDRPNLAVTPPAAGAGDSGGQA